jgi:hypothetical protein
MTTMESGQHPEDSPWNDAPADSGAVAEQPSPAEVVGDEGDELDVSAGQPGPGDPYRRDTLSERLAEEEPEARLGDGAADPEAELQAAPAGSDTTVSEVGEPEDSDELGGELPAAEDAAIHIRRG